MFRYKDCELTIEGKEVEDVPDAVGGVDLVTFEYFSPGVIKNKRGYLFFSQSVLIQHPRHGFVLNYVKVNLCDDDWVKFVARYVTPGSYEIKMGETFSMVINNGENKGGTYFCRMD